MENTTKIEALKCIKDFSYEELKCFIQEIGEPAYRADQIYTDIYSNRRNSFDGFKTIPLALRQKLSKVLILNSITSHKAQYSTDGTIKFLFDYANGSSVESVMIPKSDEDNEDTMKRMTLCVSSQVGCALDCSFCATGKLKFTRNLTAGEIVDQVLNVERISNIKISNIVFMGMGEPLMNLDNVLKAIDILTNQQAMIISRKRITISTSGIIPKMNELAEVKPPIELAVSLHATTQDLRKDIMPIAQKWDLSSLRVACENYYRKTKIPVTFEYILFDGINNTDYDANRLAKFVRAFPSKINIIQFHDISFTNPVPQKVDLSPASMEQIDKFVDKLRSLGVNAFLRTSSGFDIDAACGQLAFSKKNDGNDNG